MIIHFGLHFDRMQPSLPEQTVGEVYLGPNGLLSVLEEQLGLPPTDVRPGESLVAYRASLQEADDEGRFFHRSFKVDPINVSGTLHQWREQWYEAGWDGTLPESAPRRLADMAAVEKLADGRVPPARGQRIRRIDAALDDLGTQIDRLILHDHPAELPAAWRKLVERFPNEPAAGVQPVDAAPAPIPEVNPRRALTDLQRVQAGLLSLVYMDEGQVLPREPLSGDGTFVVLRGVSRDLSAQAIAEYLHSHGRDNTVLVAETDGIILDNALERVGLPRVGFQHYTPFRAVTQVLKLGLALLWDPLSPRLLLQFLLHPVGPLPGFARSRLASAVSDAPGIGGDTWKQALKNIEEKQRGWDATDEQVQELQKTIAQWIECPRFDPRAGAPVGALTARAQLCADWLGGRLHTEEESAQARMYGAALAQANGLIAALESLHAQGQQEFQRIELVRLLDEITGSSSDPDTFAEAGHVRGATHAATVTGSWGTVIWWDLAMNQSRAGYPWSDVELTALRTAGVDLPPVAEALRHRAHQWLRPILGARERVILAVHDTDRGHHPLWNQLTTLFENWSEVRVDDALFEGGAAELPALQLPIEHLQPVTLPSPRRWWQLPENCRPAPRDTESFSSLSKLIHHPHEWVLTYAAKLRAGSADDLSDHNLLYGSLAHHLFESFFETHEDWRSMDASAVQAWVDVELRRLIAEEGAVLLEAGRGVDRQRVMTTIERAMTQLLHHFEEAGVSEVKPEADQDGPFGEGRLCGSIDLLITLANGKEVVVDVKWGGETWRKKMLESNTQLQLATYAYLRKQDEGNGWPDQAFFIISTGNMLAQHNRVFPRALVSAPTDGGSASALWTQATASVRWRREQLAQGKVEVNVEGTEATEDSQPPEDALAPDNKPNPYDDFTILTGWAEGA